MKGPLFHSLQWKIVYTFLFSSLSATLLLVGLFTLWSYLYENEETLLLTYLSNFSTFVLFLLVSVLFSGLLFGIYTGQMIKKRLRPLKDGAIFLSSGKLAHRVPVKGTDEISQIAVEWNRMAQRLENQVSSLQKLIQKNKELADQAKQLAVMEERQRLARDLHDSVSQQLFALSMTASAAIKLFKKKPEKSLEQLLYLEEIANRAQTEMRALLLHLRPVQLEDKGLRHALDQLLQELQEKHPIRYIWELDEPGDVSKGVEEQLFRIAQEAISNTLRHSNASQVEVKLKRLSQALLLVIQDNGIGIKEEKKNKKSSYGLSMMRERAEEMGGTLQIISVKDRGTRLEVRVPYLQSISADNN